MIGFVILGMKAESINEWEKRLEGWAQKLGIEPKEGKSWSKLIELEDGYKIGAHINREPEITGFGLWGKRSHCGFSWEWFDATGQTIFTKRQEAGRVSVESHTVDEQQELATIYFDTDISLRLDEGNQEIHQPTHRILIKKGSVLRFSPTPELTPEAPARPPCL